MTEGWAVLLVEDVVMRADVSLADARGCIGRVFAI